MLRNLPFLVNVREDMEASSWKEISYAAKNDPPVQKIICEFEIDDMLSDNPVTPWNQTKEHSGISEKYFFEYFGNKACGYAIKIKRPTLYKRHRYGIYN